ncbi:hypothetical protein [Streptomyces sp. NPDC005538]|uniref:hypothetical protein n=1 Tax=unclassified Streptomyces TaxID=2593676 RepID=UPI0033B7AA11
MSELIAETEARAKEEDVPDAYRAIVAAGWIVDGDARLLAALHSGYSGTGREEFQDVIHYEVTVNGRGMMDYDLPMAGPKRREMLVRRSLGYACTALLAVPKNWPNTFGYVSLSGGETDDDMLTAHVTFCSEHADTPRYLNDLESYGQEALLEIPQTDAATLLAK